MCCIMCKLDGQEGPMKETKDVKQAALDSLQCTLASTAPPALIASIAPPASLSTQSYSSKQRRLAITQKVRLNFLSDCHIVTLANLQTHPPPLIIGIFPC